MLRLDYAAFKYPPSPKVLAAIAKALSKLNEYPDEEYNEIREALSIKYELPKEWFLVGNGLDEVIDNITRALIKEKDEVIIPSPTFSQFEQACLRVKGIPCLINCLDENEYRIDGDKILGRINKNTKIIWICSPNNPTGEYTPIDIIEEVVSKSNTIVIVDEALSDFSGKSVIKLLKRYDNLIILRTFSKGYCLAGLRIGFCIANPYIIRKIENIKQIFNVNSLAIKAAVAALEDQKYYDELWERFKTERSREISEIENLGVPIRGRESNFLLLDFGSTERSKTIYGELLHRGIRIFPGWDKEFTDLPGRYCRVVVGRREENDMFINALKDILEEENE
ncbi:MAG: pyridoxal phosphate-dependent aminotransferase [Candidatus Woesearchaeota archaeon]